MSSQVFLYIIIALVFAFCNADEVTSRQQIYPDAAQCLGDSCEDAKNVNSLKHKAADSNPENIEILESKEDSPSMVKSVLNKENEAGKLSIKEKEDAPSQGVIRIKTEESGKDKETGEEISPTKYDDVEKNSEMHIPSQESASVSEKEKDDMTTGQQTANDANSNNKDSNADNGPVKLEIYGAHSGKVDENMDQPFETVERKGKFFPLLYTLKTLFTSFISEFGEMGGNQDVITHNSSESTAKNSSLLEEVVQDSNTTMNSSEASKKSRFQCATRNTTVNITHEVKIVNSTELLEILNFSKSQKLSTCVLVMFYAPWCHFCARTAPHYNALARAFPQLDVLAVDTSHFSYLNARFGTVAVPNLMLFHSRSAVRFNYTTRELSSFIQFITNNTGLEANSSVEVTPEDYIGPLQSTVIQNRDWMLWLAWSFVITCSIYGIFRSQYGQGLVTRLGILWQEHQHIE